MYIFVRRMLRSCGFIIPPNRSSVLQPMDQVINRKFKESCLQQYVEWHGTQLDGLPDDAPLQKPSKELIAKWVNRAYWDDVKDVDIQKSFAMSCFPGLEFVKGDNKPDSSESSASSSEGSTNSSESIPSSQESDEIADDFTEAEESVENGE